VSYCRSDRECLDEWIKHPKHQDVILDKRVELCGAGVMMTMDTAPASDSLELGLDSDDVGIVVVQLAGGGGPGRLHIGGLNCRILNADRARAEAGAIMAIVKAEKAAEVTVRKSEEQMEDVDDDLIEKLLTNKKRRRRRKKKTLSAML